LIKLTGIQPSIAFNLAVPTLAALTAVNVFSLAGNLSQSSIPRGGFALVNRQYPEPTKSPKGRRSALPWDAGTVWPAEAKAPCGLSSIFCLYGGRRSSVGGR